MVNISHSIYGTGIFSYIFIVDFLCYSWIGQWNIVRPMGICPSYALLVLLSVVVGGKCLNLRFKEWDWWKLPNSTTPQKLTWLAGKPYHEWVDVFPIEHGDFFQCHVSFQGCKYIPPSDQYFAPAVGSRAPKGNEKVFQPSIFRYENVSFREGTPLYTWICL